MTEKSNIKTGIQWMLDSYHLFKQAPLKLMMLALVYFITFFILPATPGFAGLLGLSAILLWPLGMAMIIGAYRKIDQNKDISIPDLFNEIKPALNNLLLLGLSYLGYGLVVNWLTHDDLQVLHSMTNAEEPSMEMIRQATPGMIKLLLLLTPMLMATWFSPMLMAYHNYSVWHSIKSSIAGCLIWILSFGVSWLYLTFIVVVAMILLGVVVALLSLLSVALGQFMGMLMLFNFLLISTAIMLGFQYVTYRDIFEKKIHGLQAEKVT